MKKICAETDCIFIDISNVETGVTENEWSLLGEFMPEKNAATHPTKRGHEQIADAIIKALLERESLSEAAAAKDIVIDIGRYDSLDYVLVNGIFTKDYELKDHILTVHCNNMPANELCIAAKLNGKLSYTCYRLVYSNGYRAYRTYTTNNVLKVFDNILNKLN